MMKYTPWSVETGLGERRSYQLCALGAALGLDKL